MPTKHSLERRLDRLDDGGKYPIVSLAELIAAGDAGDTLETVDRERRLFRVEGQVRRVPQQMLEVLEEMAAAEQDGAS